MLLSARTHTSFQELGLNASRRKAINWTLALTVVLIASMFVGVLIGASGTSVFSTWTVISHHLFGTELGAPTLPTPSFGTSAPHASCSLPLWAQALPWQVPSCKYWSETCWQTPISSG